MGQSNYLVVSSIMPSLRERLGLFQLTTKRSRIERSRCFPHHVYLCIRCGRPISVVYVPLRCVFFVRSDVCTLNNLHLPANFATFRFQAGIDEGAATRGKELVAPGTAGIALVNRLAGRKVVELLVAAAATKEARTAEGEVEGGEEGG